MSSLEQLIQACLMTPKTDPSDPACIWGIPLNIEGLSGAGKTQRVEAASRAIGLISLSCLPATMQPEDFSGTPMRTDDGITMECIMVQANKLMNLGRGVLFIDELSTARPAVQAAALGLVEERRVGSHQLPPKVRVLCAMNPPEYAAGGFSLEAPMANRLAHIPYELPTAEQWTDWLMNGPAPERPNEWQLMEQRVIQGWNKHWSMTRGLLSGFMRVQPSLLHDQPKPNEPRSSGPWPSHRMWNWAGRGVATVRCLGLPGELEEQIIQACVGPTVLDAWIEWKSKADLPEPEDMIAGRWIPDPARLDVTQAALASMVGWVCGMGDPLRNTGDLGGQANAAVGAWSVLQRTLDSSLGDFAMAGAQLLLTKDLGANSRNQQVAAAAHPVILALGNAGFTKLSRVSA